MPDSVTRPARETHRVPADLGCLVRVGDRDYVGHTRDVAIEGLGIELSEVPGPGIIGAEVSIRLELPAVGPVGLSGVAVRATPTGIGVLIGVRVTRAGRLRRPVRKADDDAPSGPRKKPRRSRAKPRPPRALDEVRAEFRGLCGLVYEQAMLDARAEPLDSLTEWAARLAGELSLAAPGFAATYRDLLMELSRIHQEDKDRLAAATG
jgi:PilZ domain-containing protein